ncbi:MAG: hypothetical protein JJ855_07850 [Rhodospirillales bacterium]|nr:hypothetical protein [Rhodospirillales bacterium]
MSYTLDEFAADCHDALKKDSSMAGVEEVRKYVEKALKDPDLVAEYLPEDCDQERRVIYEDPELKFCICAHVYQGPKEGSPHDHGPTWAIYGQAAGETEMTDWEIVQPAEGDNPALVKLSRSYALKPGDAHAYPPGAVHAPLRNGPTRLIRVEGENTDNLKRTPIKAA